MHLTCGTRKTAWKGNVRSHFVHHKSNGVCKMNNSNTSCVCLWRKWWNTRHTQWWWWLWFDESTVVICVACVPTPTSSSQTFFLNASWLCGYLQWHSDLLRNGDVHSGVSQQKWSCSMAWKTSTSTVPLMQHSSGAAVSQLFTMWLRAVEMWNGIVSVL